MEKATKGDVPSSDSVKPMSPASTTNTNGAAKTAAPRVYNEHKFDPATEEEIRSIMFNARNISEDSQCKTETDVVKLATLTTNLIQLLNAEYIVSLPSCPQDTTDHYTIRLKTSSFEPLLTCREKVISHPTVPSSKLTMTAKQLAVTATMVNTLATSAISKTEPELSVTARRKLLVMFRKNPPLLIHLTSLRPTPAS